MRYLVAALVAIMLANAWLPGVVAVIAGLDPGGFAVGALGGFGFGLSVIVLGYRIIHNRLVESDRRNDHMAVDKRHDARRI